MRKKSLKVAVLHLAFAYSGGGEKLVLEEARGLRNRGYEVNIFTPVLNKEKCFPDFIGKYNIQALLPNLPYFVPQREIFQVILACILAPFLSFRFRNFDVILAANQPSPWLAFWVQKLFGVPYVTYLSQPTRFLHPRKIDKKTGLVFTERKDLLLASSLIKISKPLVNVADRLSIGESDSVLADGEYIKGLLERIYSIRTVNCPAGAHPVKKQINHSFRYQGRLKVNGKTITKPYILLTNRHFPQKRFEYALTALAHVLKVSPHLSLIITGEETDYTQRLKILAQQLSLQKKVLFLGLVKEKDLEKLYFQAMIYVYTAPEEDFGMGMVEAMAHGVPVVAWNNAGPTKIVIDGKTGFLARPFDITDFLDKILELTKNKKLNQEMGKRALERVKNEFSYLKHLDILEKELNQAFRANSNLYPPPSSFSSRKFWHFSYALEALEKIKGRVLDIGCGTGDLLMELKKFRPDLEIIGCDKNKKPGVSSKQFLEDEAKIVFGDAEKLPFAAKSFDAVLMFDVLEHLENPKQALKEIKRVLKKEGVFHLTVPCERSLATWDGWLYRFFRINLKRDSIGHIQLFTSEEIGKMMKEQGFEMIDYYFSRHFWDQFFSFPYFLFISLFYGGRHFDLRQKGETFRPLGFLLRIGAGLSNIESIFLKKVKGKSLHLISKKSEE